MNTQTLRLAALLSQFLFNKQTQTLTVREFKSWWNQKLHLRWLQKGSSQLIISTKKFVVFQEQNQKSERQLHGGTNEEIKQSSSSATVLQFHPITGQYCQLQPMRGQCWCQVPGGQMTKQFPLVTPVWVSAVDLLFVSATYWARKG